MEEKRAALLFDWVNHDNIQFSYCFTTEMPGFIPVFSDWVHFILEFTCETNEQWKPKKSRVNFNYPGIEGIQLSVA